jgi:Animal haem peroxidase
MSGSTTPTARLFHGRLPPRGLTGAPSSEAFGGRFGRMFRNLPVYSADEKSLVKLGEAMIQPLEDGQLDKPLGASDDDENMATLDDKQLRLPAGYTYFGQFVDHDVTFDPASSLTRQDDPDALVDYRTPRFDLDSLYGRGPADQPYLYETDGIRLALGDPVSKDPAVGGPDLQRDKRGRAIIGDPRNDENLIVSQLQVTFIKFHNAVVERVKQESSQLSDDETFKRAQQLVRWHYQWVVVHDYLPRLVGQDVVDDVLAPAPYLVPGGEVSLSSPRLRFYRWRKRPYIPVEFSVAAYRFGHSIARPSYLINDVAKPDPPVQGASRIPLFEQTDQGRQSLNGFRELPASWGVQWKFLLPGVNGSSPDGADHLPQPSYKLDAVLSHPLGALPKSTAGPEPVVAGLDPSIAQSLAVRNLLRGLRMGLPSGQDVARAMGVEPLSEEELFGGMSIDEQTRADLAGRAPLWFYILKEAEKRAESAHLGPVGGRIVAEVLIGLLAGDPLSYLSVEPNWRPVLPAAVAGTFTLSDVINVAIPASAPVPEPVYKG